MSSLLLLSSSLVEGHTYLGHAREVFADHLTGVGRLVFIPYAKSDHDAYTGRVAEALHDVCHVVGAHRLSQPDFEAAEAYFVGGGNTFRLLRTLHDLGRLEVLKAGVADGKPYAGSSAGTNIACPTIRTTNDMPIVSPNSLTALGLVPFQINAHYLDAPDSPTHHGETREERLQEFLEENDVPVVALRENSWLRVLDGDAICGGVPGDAYVRLLRRGMEPLEVRPNTSISQWLEGASYTYG